ncbi:unnamed protein product [Protopolystoma xenopodis]|uniref:Uncharacterized protein n=1 Tax=Protopolystoma xenopodis TaxID=117903 RepID=A0A3S4ZPS6_9PLAT|nr:unnamed protein product [Protopolystoma xenopodis]
MTDPSQETIQASMGDSRPISPRGDRDESIKTITNKDGQNFDWKSAESEFHMQWGAFDSALRAARLRFSQLYHVVLTGLNKSIQVRGSVLSSALFIAAYLFRFWGR